MPLYDNDAFEIRRIEFDSTEVVRTRRGLIQRVDEYEAAMVSYALGLENFIRSDSPARLHRALWIQ